MNDEDLNCITCAYRDLPDTAEPCASCDMYFSHFESSEPTDTAASEDARRCSPCSTCKYGDLPGTVGPCASCFDEGLDHSLNYEEATESGVKEIVPKHIVDMFVERVGQEVRRHVEAHNAHPRPCPYCGEIPEVVGETIYPGEEQCYVVCNGAKLLPHSISIHGRTREEAVAHWNSFV